MRSLAGAGRTAEAHAAAIAFRERFPRSVVAPSKLDGAGGLTSGVRRVGRQARIRFGRYATFVIGHAERVTLRARTCSDP